MGCERKADVRRSKQPAKKSGDYREEMKSILIFFLQNGIIACRHIEIPVSLSETKSSKNIQLKLST